MEPPLVVVHPAQEARAHRFVRCVGLEESHPAFQDAFNLALMGFRPWMIAEHLVSGQELVTRLKERDWSFGY